MAKGGQPKENPLLVEARAAFEAGDKIVARSLAQQIIDAGANERDVAAARELLERTETPPLFKTYAAVAAALIAALIVIAVLRS